MSTTNDDAIAPHVRPEHDHPKSSATAVDDDAGTIYADSHVAAEEPPKDQLRQELLGFQIFFIILSGVLGGSIFNGEALKLGGPVNLLVGTIFTGLIAVCVGETVSEFIQVFPVPNGIFSYLDAWVDEDLAWVMGLLYWYAWATVSAEEMLNAAKLVKYWNPSTFWPPVIFYFVAPCVLVVLNFFPVYVYGWIETAGGIGKSLLAVIVSLILYHISAVGNLGGNEGPINDGSKNDPAYASSPARAFCYISPFLILGFMGVEGGTVAAFEAKKREYVGWPSLWTHWIILFLYLAVTLGLVLTVSWDNPLLPPIFGGNTEVQARGADTAEPIDPNPPNTTSATIIAIHALSPTLAGVVNGCLIFSVLSAANTAIYYSSRTLWGHTYNLKGRHALSKWFKSLSVLMDNGAPARAIGISAILFCWIPFIQLGKSLSIDDVLEVLSISSSISCLLVWLALLVAFLRFKRWTTICYRSGTIQEEYTKYVRTSPEYRNLAKNKPLTLQPFTCWVGIIGICLIFIFVTAMWWDTPPSADKILAGLGPHMVALIALLAIKVFRGRPTEWWVPLDADGVELNNRLLRLEFLSEKGADRGNTVKQERDSTPQEGVMVV